MLCSYVCLYIDTKKNDHDVERPHGQNRHTMERLPYSSFYAFGRIIQCDNQVDKGKGTLASLSTVNDPG